MKETEGSHNIQYLRNSDSEMAKQMIIKLQQLLESAEIDNIMLAFKLMEGGGVPQKLMTHLLAISEWHQEELVRKAADKLIRKNDTDELKKLFKKYWKTAYNNEPNETKIAQYLNDLSQIETIDINGLANLKLRLTRKGGKFCLENNTAPYEDILKVLVENNRLYLNNFQLDFLPKEIGKFINLISLNISDNCFNQLPEEIANLTSLEGFYYERTPLESEEIKKLEKIFPKIFAEDYYYKGCDLRNDNKYEEAAKLFEKSVSLVPDFAESWHALGSVLLLDQNPNRQKTLEALKTAQKYYQKRLNKAKQEPYHWFCSACIYALLEQEDSALEYLKNAIDLNQGYKQKAIYEEDFDSFKSDPRFKEIIKI